MKMNRLLLLAASCALIAALTPLNKSAAAAEDTKKPVAAPSAAEDQQALELGRKVLAVQRALEHPQEAESLEAVKALGLDSRYYVMVRGWLSEKLRGDQSIRDASKEGTPQKIKDRITFLEKAIRAIDLE
jgi:hypothetical protein